MTGQHRSPDGLQVNLLGPIEARRGDALLPVPGRHERRVLVILALHASQRVSVDTLMELLWGDRPPRTAAKTLQAVISRLRVALAAGEDVIVWRDGGYLLHVAPEAVDALRFRRLVSSGRDRLHADDPHSAAGCLRDALSLWRAQEPAELGDTPAAAATRTSLIEARLAAVEDRIEADLALGHHVDLVAELEALTAAHPFRERLTHHLMLALYRSGRQPDALEVFRRVRRRLAQELGCDPSPALEQLRQRIDRHDPSLVSAPLAAPGNLPVEVSSFLGRARELADVAELLARARLVTLTGPGGVGKTRLAVRAARAARSRYPGGTWLVDLATLDTGAVVSSAVASTLRAVDPTEDAVLAALGSRRALLLLDDCEHVLDGVRPLVEQVLRDCPRVTVLTTSREPLAITGEHIVDVPPLDVSTAAQLFAERARAVDATFAVTDASAPVVGEICRRLDGLPLGIELAAGRVRALPLREIERQLEHGLRLLVSHRSGRHRSLDETIGWSYELLSEQARAVLRRLSVFAGSFALDTACRVCALPDVPLDDVVRRVAELAERSMLSRTGPGRYRMLETVRAFAAARLAEAGEDDAVRLAHATVLTELAESLAEQMRTPAEGEAVRRLEAELDGLRAAHAWAGTSGHDDLALRLPYALRWFAFWTTQAEVYRWATSAALAYASSGHGLVAEVIGLAALGASYRNDIQEVEALAARATQIARENGRDGSVLALLALTRTTLHRGELDRSAQFGEQLIRLAEQCGDTTAARLWRVGLLLTRTYAGQGDEAAAQIAALRTEARRESCPSLRAWMLYGHGETLSEQNPVEALRSLREAIDLATSVGNTMVLGVASVTLGSIGGRFGDPAEALRISEQVIVLWYERGGWVHLWTLIRNLVELLARVGRASDAVSLHGAAAVSSTAPPAFGEQGARLADLMKRLEHEIGSHAFVEAIQRGESMTDEEAVEFARTAIAQAAATTGTRILTAPTAPR